MQANRNPKKVSEWMTEWMNDHHHDIQTAVVRCSDSPFTSTFVSLHYATSVSAGRCSVTDLLYPCFSRMLRKSLPVYSRTLTTFHCNDLIQCLVCSCGGIQSNNVTKQCLAPLADDICTVWQTDPVGYVDVLDMVLPLHTQYLALA